MDAPISPLAAVTHPDPYRYYAALRARGAVHWADDIAAWVVVDAVAIAEVLRAPQAQVRPPAEPVPAFLQGTTAAEVFAALARMNDGSPHRAARGRVLALVRRLGGAPLALAATRAAALLAAGLPSGHAAGLDELVRALPVTAIAAALGFPESAWPGLLAATQAWVGGLSPLATPLQRLAAVDAMGRLRALFEATGVTSTDDAAAHLALLMQPHEATAGLIGAGLLRLARDDALREAAMAGRLPWRAFGAEVLRHDPPIQNTRRTLAADLCLERQTLHAGDTVLLVLAAAAQDPARSDAPAAFRLDRPAPDGASTGHWALGDGPHACPGGDAALVIATAGWRWVVEHWDAADLKALADRVAWRPSLNARLPVFAPLA